MNILNKIGLFSFDHYITYIGIIIVFVIILIISFVVTSLFIFTMPYVAAPASWISTISAVVVIIMLFIQFRFIYMEMKYPDFYDKVKNS